MMHPSLGRILVAATMLFGIGNVLVSKKETATTNGWHPSQGLSEILHSNLFAKAQPMIRRWLKRVSPERSTRLEDDGSCHTVPEPNARV